MTTFLINGENVYDYGILLIDINNSTDYYPRYKSSNLYKYFLNLIVALAANKPLMLIDSDLNESEIDGLNVDNINLSVTLHKFNFSSMTEVIKSIQFSTSEITIFTSGTTGQPKKVVHTVATLTRNIKISSQYAEQIWGFAYNPTHMAGLQVFFQAFENMNTLVNVFNHNRLQIYNAINKYSITHISATPTFFRLLLPVEKSFNTISRVTLGGEKSDYKLQELVHQIFPKAKINNIYASTEAGSIFAAKGENFQIPKIISDKIKVEEEELLIHRSLLGKSDSFTFSNDFYHTGDLIEWIDKEEGLFRFKGRNNELINIGGYKVNPLEIETAILQIPEVLQVMVYGKANSILGNILCAEIKIEEMSNLTELAIRNYLSLNVQDFKIPRRINFVNSFSLTRTGKLKRL